MHLASDKARADVIRARVVDISAELKTKSAEHAQAKEQLRIKSESNSALDKSSKALFEVEVQFDSLGKTRKRYQDDLDNLKANLNEIAGSLSRACNFARCPAKPTLNNLQAPPRT